MLRQVLTALFVAASLSATSPARETKPDDAAIEFFERKVRPVLVEHCYACHSAEKKRRGGLMLDSRAGLLKGGDSGPAIVPGSPEKSLLVKVIGYADEPKMPPRSKLPPQAIADLTAWVKMGAPWPGGDKPIGGSEKFDFDARRKHWSFQPVRPESPPQVNDTAWPRTPIDRFILARLEAKGLKPAAPADRRTLMRRLSYDLTGLPPTPDEVKAFVSDASPTAVERVIDRLLSSPAYGERWGRHWLDLMRFSETSGHEFDYEISHAYRYRDAVVRALNDDLPYDAFVREHVAGDLLPSPRRHPIERTDESILLTAFWFLGESKHSPVDLRVDGGDRRDNMIDVFGKAFLGLTISCARCHDHKFDPIYTKDYYALVSTIQSSRQQVAFIDPPERRAQIDQLRTLHHDASKLASALSAKSLEARLTGLEVALSEARKEPTSALAKALARDDLFRAWHVLADPALKTAEAWEGKRKLLLADARTATQQASERGKEWTRFDDFRDSDYRNWFVTGEAFGKAPSRIGDVAIDASKDAPGRLRRGAVASGRLEGALRSKTFTLQKKHVLLRARGQNVRVNLIIDGFQLIQDPIYGGLRYTINSPTPRWHVQNVSMWLGQKAYLEILDDGDGWCEVEEIQFSDHATPPPIAPNPLVTTILAEAKSLEDVAKGYAKSLGQAATAWAGGKPLSSDHAALLENLTTSPVIAALPAPVSTNTQQRERLTQLLDKATRLEQTLPRAQRALAIADGDDNDDRVHIRGNPKMLGEVAPRRLPVVLGGESMAAPKNSGRLDLATKLTSADSPLFARVMVNRLWHHHFGHGLVRSVDDFGHQGEKPSHPELLDWLAAEFARGGWSLKHLHRLMLLSATYQQSSRADEESDKADPKNDLLHRMSIRRLEAECIRDAMLSVSGRLDRTMHGRGPLPHLTEFMLGRGRPGASGPLDGDGRRSIYLAVRRNFLNPMFLAFDYPIPFTTIGRRSVSNVPAQALTLLNNPFVIQQAKLWGERVASMDGGEPERIQAMYQIAYGRNATAEELRDARAFLAEQGKEYGKLDARAWADLAHVLFNVKEFIFVS